MLVRSGTELFKGVLEVRDHEDNLFELASFEQQRLDRADNIRKAW